MPAYSKEVEKWYHRKIWYQLHAIVLARDPICRLCLQNGDTPPQPSVVADHIKPHAGNWDLFTDLDHNLWGLCKRHHDEKTATENYGIGNASRKYVPQRRIAHTGSNTGPEFISSSIPRHVLDRAVGGQKELDDLLKDIPE
jgi:hypothetical protein